MPPPGYDWRYTVQITSTGTADVKTATPTELNAAGALITAETNPARLTVDGSTPSATNGHFVPTGMGPILILLSSDVLKVVSTTAANSILNITWGY